MPTSILEYNRKDTILVHAPTSVDFVFAIPCFVFVTNFMYEMLAGAGQSSVAVVSRGSQD